MEQGKDIVSQLIEKKVISEDQLQIAKREQEKTRGQKSIAVILAEMGFVSEGMIGEIMSESAGVKKFDFRSSIINAKLVKKIPKEFAIHNKLIAVGHTKTSVTIAMSDIFDIVAIDQVRKSFPSQVQIIPVYATENEIISAIDQYYDYEMSIEGILKEVENSRNKGIGNDSDLKGDYRSPVVRLVDAIITDAVHRGASDLHFEPENLFLRIRYRVDGKMTQIRSIHKEYWSAISVRIKIIAGLNITETRRSQDGRIQTEVLGRRIDLRVSSHPTIHGENIVMRILDEKRSISTLEELGFSENNLQVLNKIINKPEGVIIITGPTGSGKTTTLYTVLNKINTIDKNIMTLEDPVEYRIPLIRQSHIRSDIGMDFASGIRTLLRQDPDVILVGEVRDAETAVTAIQAAMTGHQVYTSLHTNDAVSAIPRLMNMGVPQYLMSGSLIGVVAQRLCRKLCQFCKKKYKLNPEEREAFSKYKIEELYRAEGCDKCNNSGYRGRIVIAEVFAFDEELDELVANKASRRELLKYINSKGFVSMAEDGLIKAKQGLLDLKELTRIVDLSKISK